MGASVTNTASEAAELVGGVGDPRILSQPLPILASAKNFRNLV